MLMVPGSSPPLKAYFTVGATRHPVSSDPRRHMCSAL